ncbi:MAG: hypothetical protein ACFFED_09795 [Candidatus Thorarchaeota archaeon]
MSECPDCDIMRKKSTEKELYPCALCGEKRCADHTIWVPAHELDKYSEEVTRIREMLREKPHAGWYAFCGKGTHIPRGLSIRHGRNREGGRMVQMIPNDQKKEGLEFFNWWEVGIIENAMEKWWDVSHYALSCSLAPVMVIMAYLLRVETNINTAKMQMYEKGIVGMASKKEFFMIPSKDTFLKMTSTASSAKEFVDIICLLCGIVPCLNRQTAYHDEKKFKKMQRDPTI